MVRKVVWGKMELFFGGKMEKERCCLVLRGKGSGGDEAKEGAK